MQSPSANLYHTVPSIDVPLFPFLGYTITDLQIRIPILAQQVLVRRFAYPESCEPALFRTRDQ